MTGHELPNAVYKPLDQPESIIAWTARCIKSTLNNIALVKCVKKKIL